MTTSSSWRSVARMKWMLAFVVVLGCGGGDAESESTAGDETPAETTDTAEVSDEEPAEVVDLYAGDLEMICNSSVTDSGVADAPAEDKARVLARYIEEHIQSDEARNLFQALATMAPESRVEVMTQEAQSKGITECAILEFWGPPPAE